VKICLKGKAVELTGHSMGAGMATIAGARSGLHTTTFNPAHINSETFKKFHVNPPEIPKGLIDNYRVPFEFVAPLEKSVPNLPEIVQIADPGLALDLDLIEAALMRGHG
jgi:hypothetical protein